MRKVLTPVWLILSATAPAHAQDEVPLAIVGATVITMTAERLLSNYTVIVRGEVIAAVGPAAEVDVPANARRVDGAGLYLMPGLTDAHYHLYEPHDLEVLLAHGVTTILNQSGAPLHLDLRDAIRAGSIAGPTIYTTGPQLKDEAHPVLDTERTVATVADARRLVEAHAAAGYDFVKPWSGFSREIYDVIAAEAEVRGIRLIGHVPRSVGLRGVAQAGQSIAHVEEFYSKHFGRSINDAGIAEAVSIVAGGDIAVSTTLITYEMIARTVSEGLGGLLERPGRRLVDPVRQLMWEAEYNDYRRDRFMQRGPQHYRDALAFQQRIAKALHDAGVPLLAGTDAGFLPGIVPGQDLHRELELLVEAGLSPFEPLETATRNPGAFLEPQEPFGTVEVGTRADLMLLGANPLSDIGSVRSVVGIVSRGRYYSGTDLAGMLASVEEANERTGAFVEEVMTGGAEAARRYIESWRDSGRTERPFESMPVLFLGYALGSQGDLQGALGLFRLAADVHPDDYLAAYMLAGVLLITGDHDGAREAYERVLEIRPGHPEAERLLSSLRARAR